MAVHGAILGLKHQSLSFALVGLRCFEDVDFGGLLFLAPERSRLNMFGRYGEKTCIFFVTKFQISTKYSRRCMFTLSCILINLIHLYIDFKFPQPLNQYPSGVPINLECKHHGLSQLRVDN